MENLLKKYLSAHNLSVSNFARLMNSAPSSVYNWTTQDVVPNPLTAWKIHKLTNGEVPITYWGYTIYNGKIKKIENGPIRI